MKVFVCSCTLVQNKRFFLRGQPLHTVQSKRDKRHIIGMLWQKGNSISATRKRRIVGLNQPRHQLLHERLLPPAGASTATSERLVLHLGCKSETWDFKGGMTTRRTLQCPVCPLKDRKHMMPLLTKMHPWYKGAGIILRVII